ncbi:MAG: preprotein translocase subunit SecE [Endomicrobium sp.]|jgi:preprotein translocase subunit SecE|nr:preprotein translocase subunit SecE [Endomicrobium sp.]
MNLIKEIKLFLINACNELIKITWISKSEAIRISLVVLFFIIVMSIFINLIDFFLVKIISIVL